jgi:predicted nucleic acid-binding protein
MGIASGGLLLDTNVVSELRKEGRANPAVRRWAAATPPSDCFISAVTLAEVAFGVERASNARLRAGR